MAGRPSKTLDVPDSPGPGQYIDVHLSVKQTEIRSAEGFGKRDSPRFPAGERSIMLLVCYAITTLGAVRKIGLSQSFPGSELPTAYVIILTPVVKILFFLQRQHVRHVLH